MGVHDLLEGEIMKTPTPGGWHFFNLISGIRYDFTASQFSTPLNYENIASNREEAFNDTIEKQYKALKQKLGPLS